MYLGALVVVPRDQIKAMDQWGCFDYQDLEGGLRKSLADIFCLTPVCEREDARSDDLALEVVVAHFQGAEFWSIDTGSFRIPYFWRPKVHLKARLYFIDTMKTKASCEVLLKLSLSQYFSRLLSWNGLFRFRPLFGEQDMNLLLSEACLKLLRKMAKSM